MNKISVNAVEDAAKRIAVKHFFCGVETHDDVNDIWLWTTLDECDAVWEFSNNNNNFLVWFPFQDWDLMEILDAMDDLKNSIVAEITEELQ